MTDRHPMDCYITPPCAARALGSWLMSHDRYDDATCDGEWLDPFAGPGALLPWMLHLDAEFVPDDLTHAFELDMRWDAEQAAYIPAMNRRMGRDSLAIEWAIRRSRPNVSTNIPFGVTAEALARCRDHAYDHGRVSSVLMRTDWWQHKGRAGLRPDHMLLLEWRPSFGFRLEPKTQRLVMSTDYAGYVFCVYEPRPTGRTETHFLARPSVPDHLRAEHRRLARLAYSMGMEAQGATT